MRAAAVTFIAATVIVALYFGREVLIPVAIAVLSDKGSAEAMERSVTIRLICYASHPSEAVRRYTLRKLSLGGGARQARYLVIDPAPSIPGATGAADTFAGDVAALCRLAGGSTCGGCGPPFGVGVAARRLGESGQFNGDCLPAPCRARGTGRQIKRSLASRPPW